MNIDSSLLASDATLSPLSGTLKTSQAAPAQNGASTESGGQGDSVTISEEGRQQAAKLTTKSGSSNQDATETAIENLKNQIDKVKEQIEKVKNGDLPEKQKQQQVLMLQNQLIQLNDQLAKLQQKSGGGASGGTRAEGFANSLT